MIDFGDVNADSLIPKLIGSALLVALAIALEAIVRRVTLRHTAQADLRRRWIVGLRNAAILLTLVGLASIWVAELRAVATALIAFTVAFVIAMKEFILCINGSLLRTATNAYSVGDRIEIDGHRGDVIDFTLFSTRLMEVGPGRQYHLRTGRTIVVPNSKLLDTLASLTNPP